MIFYPHHTKLGCHYTKSHFYCTVPFIFRTKVIQNCTNPVKLDGIRIFFVRREAKIVRKLDVTLRFFYFPYGLMANSYENALDSYGTIKDWCGLEEDSYGSVRDTVEKRNLSYGQTEDSYEIYPDSFGRMEETMGQTKNSME